eukprot:9128139-Pyramimonas_sp.AAC.1
MTSSASWTEMLVPTIPHPPWSSRLAPSASEANRTGAAGKSSEHATVSYTHLRAHETGAYL